jgi:hypothetical protein
VDRPLDSPSYSMGRFRVTESRSHLRAELVEENKNLPRIPPLRGTVALEWRHQAVTLRREMVMVNHQTRLFDNERRRPVMQFSMSTPLMR